jgi:hypothetical protein
MSTGNAPRAPGRGFQVGLKNKLFGGNKMTQGSNCGNVQNSTSGMASSRPPVAVNQIENTRDRGRTLRHLFFATFFALVISSGFSAMAQVGSTDRDSPYELRPDQLLLKSAARSAKSKRCIIRSRQEKDI